MRALSAVVVPIAAVLLLAGCSGGDEQTVAPAPPPAAVQDVAVQTSLPEQQLRAAWIRIKIANDQRAVGERQAEVDAASSGPSDAECDARAEELFHLSNAVMLPQLRREGCSDRLEELQEQAQRDVGAAEDGNVCGPSLCGDMGEGLPDEEYNAEFSSEDPDGYVTDGLESACSQGTATIEECFGPGSDLDGNGVADINE